MARQFSKGIDLYKHQKARFEATLQTMRSGHAEIAQMGVVDGKNLTSGQPTGSARKKLLRQLGHPFGRGLSAAARTATGKRRGGSRSSLPLLPVGVMSGRLRASIGRKQRNKGAVQRFDVGPINSPGPGMYRLRPQGTSKMVGSPFFKEIKRRWRPRNKALIDVVRAKQIKF